MTLFAALNTTPQMSEIFNVASFVEAMRLFEIGLAEAQANAGLISSDESKRAISHVKAVDLSSRDLVAETLTAGNPAIPFVGCLKADADKDLKNLIHKGSTSQDVIDTALMLLMQRGLSVLFDGVSSLQTSLKQIAIGHTETVVMGRTLGQQGEVTTFGLKVAIWYRAVKHQQPACAVQLGGAVGNLSGMQKDGKAFGPAVRKALAKLLSLKDSGYCWHTTREPLFEVLAYLERVLLGLTKINTDLSFQMQSEVGELSEGATGGSTAMAHKRNPVKTLLIAAACRQGLNLLAGKNMLGAQANERAAGQWHAEWAMTAQAFQLTAFAVREMGLVLDDLQIHEDRMLEHVKVLYDVIKRDNPKAAERFEPSNFLPACKAEMDGILQT